MKLPVDDWQLTEDVWSLSTVVIAIPDRHYRFLAFYDEDGVLSNWYVNIERPFSRNPDGVSFTDLFVDVVAAPDLKSWKLKDEDELLLAADMSLISQQETATVRTAIDDVVRIVESKGFPFDQDWDTWRPESGLPPRIS